jgi:hypothetical protein
MPVQYRLRGTARVQSAAGPHIPAQLGNGQVQSGVHGQAKRSHDAGGASVLRSERNDERNEKNRNPSTVHCPSPFLLSHKKQKRSRVHLQTPIK